MNRSKTINEAEDLTQTEITIKGMHCSACETLLTDVLTELPGVTDAKVSIASSRAVIQHERHVRVGDLRSAIEAEGYTTL